MHAEPEDTSRKVLRFIGEKDVDEKLLKDSLKFCAFENLKKLEQSRTIDSFTLNPGDESDPESFKVRRGEVGGYTRYLSADDIRYIEEIIALQKFDFKHFTRAPLGISS
jgi:hypothetical protein